MTPNDPDSSGRLAGTESACGAVDLAASRRQLLSEGSKLHAAELRHAWLDLHESWLMAKAAEIGIADDSGFAIVGIGGLGRHELLPYSDLDLMLLHDNKSDDVLGKVADKLWYPLWDANVRLDHSVRTVSGALGVANADMIAALGMLDARHIAGDARLSDELNAGARRQWRSAIRSRMNELVEITQARWERCGRIAQRAEPDLKSGRGGLRDVQLLDALGVAQLIDRHGMARPESPGGSLDDAHLTLLDVRTELHRVSGRGRDQLQAQYADEISAALHIGDRFDLARKLSDAGRTIAYHAETGIRTAENALPRRGVTALVRRPKRRPLDEGVVEYAGEIVLARDARPDTDVGLVLRVAAAAADTGLPIGAATLSRLAASAPEMPVPWPRDALDDLLVVLSAGPTTVTTIEALDRTGLWGRLLPEWDAIRDLPPRDVAHKWTVDRHVIETAVNAAPLSTRVARPDLLALGALLHDIGKGRGVDHSVLGAGLALEIGPRLGIAPVEVELLAQLVRHHLLLPMVATRSDLNDPKTIERVVKALSGDALLLDVLHALTEADSKATGPGVWSEWKASLIEDLVRRCRLVMAGEPLPEAEPTAPQYLSLAADRGVHVDIKPSGGERLDLVMAAPDQRGLVSKAAAVLALNSLRIHSASASTHEGFAIVEFVVSPLFGSPPEAGLLRQQFTGALGGDVDVFGTLEKRDSDAVSAATSRAGEIQVGVPVTRSSAPPRILWVDSASPDQLIVEVRAMDRLGLLALLTHALERAETDIVWAKVNTFGSTAADVFCVTVSGQAADGAEHGARDGVEQSLLAVLGGPAVEVLEEPVGD
ncbi:bifunctional uridylyltransferase/uridylyl-removing enzyme [Mycobacterium mantenii]|uniref:Bifunctional uridylyltransferase/uridylyl-removing enzyme n=1 Tax=Mycobacterium mantenii TaxID=560555 RepID=A0A1X0FKJ0_MYCNT|nr:[protein-PII] uridylyltransferase [Mycobacterium mantenii]MCV7246114.1 [protein-PII] uridylyltransferase [Mycobacterium mantenii]ORB02332.1 [protein-PII] uridylyltransferase [Mycobacterium mantenii]BBY36034.1 bifunctional uridylyltransferase/uridylyl-removing enzyme [Mycobacterium mantenii]